MLRLPQPHVEFRDGQLCSTEFNDVYFAKDGPEECRRTFMHPARIPQRAADADCFTVFELGFGTGLSFLTIAAACEQMGGSGRLRFFSVESRPLSVATIHRALAAWRSELPLLGAFLASYPPPIPGWHRRHFSNGSIELNVYFGDVNDALNDFGASDSHGVDAWILDGFSPDRNAEMWAPAVLSKLAKKTRANGTVTTFSAAGTIRRLLSASGFSVRRVDALPHKRHTSLGVLVKTPYGPRASPQQVNVVGAGIAGVSVAAGLLRRGVAVSLVDLRATPGAATSAIRWAIQHGRLSVAATPEAQFRAHSCLYSQSLFAGHEAVRKLGAIQFVDAHMPEKRLNAVHELLTAEWCQPFSKSEATELVGSIVNQPTYWFPKSNLIDVRAWCLSVLRDKRIEFRRVSSTPPLDPDIPTVLATGAGSLTSVGLPALEIATLEGQVDRFNVFSRSVLPKAICVHDGYVAPAGSNLVVGSTYEYSAWKLGEATRINLVRANKILPDAVLDSHSVFRGRRLVTSDRLPVGGKVAERLWLSLGHGSSGTTSAPFMGEQIASLLCGELPPGTEACQRAVDPFRFERRQQRRPNPFRVGQNPSAS